MIHEDVRDPQRLAAALMAGHEGVPQLLALATAVRAYAFNRLPALASTPTDVPPPAPGNR